MEKKLQIKELKIEDIIQFFKKEDGVVLTQEEATEIASFLRLLMMIAVKKIMEE